MRCLASSATVIFTPASAYFMRDPLDSPLLNFFLIMARPPRRARSLIGIHWSAVEDRGDYCQQRRFDQTKTSEKSGSSARFRDAGGHSRRQKNARESVPAPKPPAKHSATCKS